MSERDFCVWFAGFLDGSGGSLDKKQLEVVKGKLDSVFLPPVLELDGPPPWMADIKDKGWAVVD